MNKISILCDNFINKFGLSSEHGLSVLLTFDNDFKILFDTGKTDLFLKNCYKLGIDISSLSGIILSHGHYDHTGGLKSLLENNNLFLSKKVYATDKTFLKKSKSENNSVTFLGSPITKQNLIDDNFEIIEIDRHFILNGNIHLFNKIPFSTDFEKVDDKFIINSINGIYKDEMEDEIILCIEERDYVIILSGCAHRGICNIVKYVYNKFKKRIKCVIGGFHISNKNSDYFNKTVECLKKFDIETMLPLHCTGEKYIKELKQHFRILDNYEITYES